MNGLKMILRELYSLFVDDGLLAAAALAWLGVMKWLALSFSSIARYGGVLLFVGLAAILIESSLRFSRRRKR